MIKPTPSSRQHRRQSPRRVSDVLDDRLATLVEHGDPGKSVRDHDEDDRFLWPCWRAAFSEEDGADWSEVEWR
jgi:hypothetical protein